MVWTKADCETLACATCAITLIEPCCGTMNTFIETPVHILNTIAQNQLVRMGNGSVCSSNNYASRRSINGVADTFSGNNSGMAYTCGSTNDCLFIVSYTLNIAGREKIVMSHVIMQENEGAGTAPGRSEMAGKWDITCNQITHFSQTNQGATNFAACSTMVGFDAD